MAPCMICMIASIMYCDIQRVFLPLSFWFNNRTFVAVNIREKLMTGGGTSPLQRKKQSKRSNSSPMASQQLKPEPGFEFRKLNSPLYADTNYYKVCSWGRAKQMCSARIPFLYSMYIEQIAWTAKRNSVTLFSQSLNYMINYKYFIENQNTRKFKNL